MEKSQDFSKNVLQKKGIIIILLVRKALLKLDKHYDIIMMRKVKIRSAIIRQAIEEFLSRQRERK